MNKKISELELLRGGAIVLVVLAHITFHNNSTLLQHFIVYFCMPLFLGISGFLFGFKDINRLNTWQDRREYLIKKFISLGIPYVLFSIIYIILNSILNRYVDTNNAFELNDIFYILFSPVAQYWYLWSLLAFFCISCIVINVNNLKFVFLISVLANLIWCFFNGDTDLTVYAKTIMYYLYFVGAACLGQMYSKNNFLVLLQNVRTQIVLFVLEVIFIATGLLRQSCYGETGVFISILQLVNTMLGILGFLFIVYNIGRIKIFKKVIFIIADYSWYIFIIHSYFTSVSKTLLLRLVPNISIFPYYVISLVFTVLGCIIIGYLTKKIALIDFMFYPQKYFKPSKHR